MLIFYRYSKSGCKEKKNNWFKQKIFSFFKPGLPDLFSVLRIAIYSGFYQ